MPRSRHIQEILFIVFIEITSYTIQERIQILELFERSAENYENRKLLRIADLLYVLLLGISVEKIIVFVYLQLINKLIIKRRYFL